MLKDIPTRMNLYHHRDKMIKSVRSRLLSGEFQSQVWLSEQIGMLEPHMSALLAGKKDRPLTAQMVAKFIDSGHLCVEDICDFPSIKDEKEMKFWRLMKKIETVRIKFAKILCDMDEAGMPEEEQLELLSSAVESKKAGGNPVAVVKASIPKK
jgi:hypothetical protein